MAAPSILPGPIGVSNNSPASAIAQIKEQYGLYSGGEIGRMVEALPVEGYIVEGLLRHASVNILVGDSGIGKTALGYQLALSVASGKPFLGFPVQKSKVLLVDYENGIWDFHWILEQQRKHLGLAEYPSNFLLSPGHPNSVPEEVIARLHPQLVILDSLRSYHPPMERDSVAATQRIRQLRNLVRRFGTAVLLMHHVHKRSAGPADLEDGNALDWLLRTAGSRALINQTDLRLALAARKDGTLVMRGQARTRGEIGPVYLRRCRDADGEPLGYERFQPQPSLLNNPEQEAVFRQIPALFRFKDARRVCGKGEESTNRFLHRLMDLGLASKVAFGRYRKCETGGEAGELG